MLNFSLRQLRQVPLLLESDSKHFNKPKHSVVFQTVIQIQKHFSDYAFQ